ncbi:MAG: carbohydrate kinase, YjeF related protein [uncultured archaeon A07HR60]|nr:MAG: carbohydrate kinase, YjeF related protein [uncultured archaeon A07HR60]
MISSDRMAAVDRNTAALGVPRKQLMESSGGAVARQVREMSDPGASVALVCGRGNNGGDGLVAARFLSDYDVRVFLLGRPTGIRTKIARENWEALGPADIPHETVPAGSGLNLDGAEVIVDAMLGTGVTGSLREPEATCAESINRSEATVLSVDVPSGVDADTGKGPETAVDADQIITFHDQKPGHDHIDASVSVADIGIPAAAQRFTGPGDLLSLSRDPAGHKGDHGEVLVVGGGPYTGAPALAGQAALRAGADLVRLAVPAAIANEVQGYDENLIVRPIPGERLSPSHVDRLLELTRAHDTVLIGPGLGDADATMDAVASVLNRVDGRVVVDADALSVVPTVDTDAELICTPHRGELVAMGGPEVADPRDRTDTLEAYAAELNCTILLKSQTDCVTDGDRHRLNRTGNPAMTVGGTGDVLAGATAALACRLDAFQAASVAAYATGRAGDLTTAGHTRGLLATDLLASLPDALTDD